MTRIKICGITRLEDARVAVEAGADALGFMFYPGSIRAITPEACAAILKELPDLIQKVGVFVDEDPSEIQRTVEVCGLDTLQFHGRESAVFCGQFRPLSIWKAFRIRSRASLEALSEFTDVDAWLLDSYVPGEMGGTGSTFNWELAAEARTAGRPIVLAGGLTPQNVGDAVRLVHPFAVDVSSGVESSPGVKDAERIRAFLRAVRSASQ